MYQIFTIGVRRQKGKEANRIIEVQTCRIIKTSKATYVVDMHPASTTYRKVEDNITKGTTARAALG